jgi:uncharacterized damage-inducible protein DinB
MNRILINSLLQQIENILYEKSWLDESFRHKLMDIHEQNAFLQPAPGIKSIAELMHHLLVWRKEILSRLHGKARALDMESKSNWLPLEELKAIGWTAILEGFYQTQQELKDFFADKEDSFLENIHADSDYPYGQLLEGVLHHDLYHLGQIGITIKFLQK